MNDDIRLFSTTVSFANAYILNIMDASFFVYQHHWFNMFHNHNACEMFFLLQGGCVLELENQENHFEENNIFVVSPNIYHKISWVNDDTQMFAIKVILSHNKNMEKNVCDVHNPLYSFLYSDTGISMLSNCQNLIMQIRMVRSELYHRLPGFREKVAAHFQIFYIDLMRYIMNHQAHSDQMVDPDITIDTKDLRPENQAEIDESILDYYFYRRYMYDLTITDLAKTLGMSVSNTHRLVKQTYGLNFMQKLAQTRIIAAKKMLEESIISLEEVAEKVGYQSYNGFFDAFKKQMNMTPSQYRNNCQDGTVRPGSM